MGVADEWEEVEEYALQMEQMKRQVSSLTSALTKLQTNDKVGDAAEAVDCSTADCVRPIDWYCKFCKTFICTRCSKKPCGNQDHHEIVDFEEIYKSCKAKYTEWKGGKESTLGTLKSQQKRIEEELTRELQMMAGAAPQDLMGPELGRIVQEMPKKKELLESITKKVREAVATLGTYGGNIDSLSQTEFVRVFAELDLTSSLFEVTNLDRITLSQEYKVVAKGICYNLDITPSGDILVGASKRFDVCDKEGEVVRSVPVTLGAVTSIQYYKGKIYTLINAKAIKKRLVLVFDLPNYEEVNRWELPPYEFVSMLAVSNDKVYVVDPDNKRVKIYTLDGKEKSNFSHPAFKNPNYMSSCPPDGVLVADRTAGIVYKIECSTDKIAWKFEMTSPRGVYCDKLGIMWSWSSTDKAFHLRSADGKQTKKIEHKGLVSAKVEFITGMFMSEGYLWCAAGSGGCTGVFRVQVNIAPESK